MRAKQGSWGRQPLFLPDDRPLIPRVIEKAHAASAPGVTSLAEVGKRGGQIVFTARGEDDPYLICQVSTLQRGETVLAQLAIDLHRIAHLFAIAEDARFRYAPEAEPASSRDHDLINDADFIRSGLIVDPRFDGLGLREAIMDVLEGRRDRLPIWRARLEEGASFAGVLALPFIANAVDIENKALDALVVLVVALLVFLLTRWLVDAIIRAVARRSTSTPLRAPTK